MNRETATCLISVLLLGTGLFAVPAARAGDLEESRTELIRRTEEYGEQLSALLALEKTTRQELDQAAQKRRDLRPFGLVSKNELAQSEEKVQQADARIAELVRQIRESEQMAAEVRLACERAEEEIPNVIRFAGLTEWSPETIVKVGTFFTRRFGEVLPVSAVGQTALHSRFGLVHDKAVDVALHPDSAEGRALLEYLRISGMPFIAFRSAVPGSATGAHIHIGPPSQRIHSVL